MLHCQQSIGFAGPVEVGGLTRRQERPRGRFLVLVDNLDLQKFARYGTISIVRQSCKFGDYPVS